MRLNAQTDVFTFLAKPRGDQARRRVSFRLNHAHGGTLSSFVFNTNQRFLMHNAARFRTLYVLC